MRKLLSPTRHWRNRENLMWMKCPVILSQISHCTIGYVLIDLFVVTGLTVLVNELTLVGQHKVNEILVDQIRRILIIDEARFPNFPTYCQAVQISAIRRLLQTIFLMSALIHSKTSSAYCLFLLALTFHFAGGPFVSIRIGG